MTTAYLDALEEAKAERLETQRRLEELDTVIRYLEQFVTRRSQNSQGVAQTTMAGFNQGRFKGMSAPKAAEVVLQEKGRGMHVKDIVMMVLAGGYDKQHDPKKLQASLYTNMTRLDQFDRLGKGRFGLTEWKKRDAEPK